MIWFSSTYWTYYLMGIILIPGLIFAIYAQSKVTKNFNKYKKIMSRRGYTAAELSRSILDEAGLNDVEVIRVNGNLTDHYDPRKKVVALSSEVHDSSSVASLGIAAHEVGHALQYGSGYFPAKLRSFIIPFSNIISSILWPLVLIGLMLNFGAETGGDTGMAFVLIGIVFFSIAVVLNLLTLPVEFNASKRAMRLLEDSGMLEGEELTGAKRVLNAAALTYVAALVVSILNLLRFVLVVFMDRD